MDDKIYNVARIEGEYAYLKDEESGEELFIAMALLPFGIDVGSRVSYSSGEFSII